jgi:hypothetical protein
MSQRETVWQRWRSRVVIIAIFAGCLAVALRATDLIFPQPEGERRGEIVTDASAGACPDRVTRGALMCEVNAVRRANGLPPLRHHGRLARAAVGWSIVMTRSRFFGHELPGRPSLTRRIARTGYLRGARQWVVGENLAFGAGSAARPAAIVGAWMRSPEHRDQLLYRGYRDAGLGIVGRTPEGGRGFTFTLDFGRRYR